MRPVSYDVALLAPIPLEHLEDGSEVCRREGRVAFGSRAWEVFRKLDDLRNGLPVEVFIYASHDPGVRRLVVSWRALYIGHVESVNGAHPEGMKVRPPSTARYLDDNQGYWAVFWEVEELHRLEEGQGNPTGSFWGLEKANSYGRNFVPEGPILIRYP
jgi:hypothetical protein